MDSPTGVDNSPSLTSEEYRDRVCTTCRWRGTCRVEYDDFGVHYVCPDCGTDIDFEQPQGE